MTFKFNLLYILYMSIMLSVLCSACKERKSNTDSIKNEGMVLPLLPPEIKTKLLKECRFIDYIMHNLPISVSQSEQEAIMANVLFIDDTAPVKIPANCKPIARKFYQYLDGSSLEADLYFNTDCIFYVFLEDGKPKYAANITDKGKNFYAQIIQVGTQGKAQ